MASEQTQPRFIQLNVVYIERGIERGLSKCNMFHLPQAPPLPAVSPSLFHSLTLLAWLGRH